MSDDPWERREREKSKRAAVQRKKNDWDIFGWVAENARALSLLVAIALLLSSEIPSFSGTLRGMLAIGGTGILLAVAALLRQWQRTFSELVRSPLSIATVALVLWSGVSFALSPYRPQAGAEFLRVAAGATAFFLVAFGLSASERNTLSGGILTLGSAVSLVDFARMSQFKNAGTMRESIGTDYSFFGTHENVGSLLALLVPIAISLALSQELEERRRWAAYAGTLILTFAWLAARCRSAWIGGGVALVVLAILIWRSPKSPRARPLKPRERVRAALASPLPILVGATLVMAIGGGFATFISQRAATATKILDDGSLTTRIQMWEGAARMAAQKPLTGWGLGSYPVLQGWWTHLGAPEVEVLDKGASHENIAHDFYVQWAAEAGGIGLSLYLAVFLLWLFQSLPALGRPLLPIDRAIALGSIAAVAGAAVDAIASPAYQFHGVYTVLWLVMGVATATTGLRAGEVSTRRTLLPMTLVAVFGAVALASLVPLWGRRLNASPQMAGRGAFELLSDPAGPKLAPGTTVTLRAQFRDAFGKRQNTSPGTTWELPSERESGSLKGGIGQLVPEPGSETQAALQVTLPNKPGSVVQVMARYTDRSGRAYTGSQVFLLTR